MPLPPLSSGVASINSSSVSCGLEKKQATRLKLTNRACSVIGGLNDSVVEYICGVTEQATTEFIPLIRTVSILSVHVGFV